MEQTVRYADTKDVKGIEKQLQETGERTSNTNRLLSAIESQMPKELARQKAQLDSAIKEYEKRNDETDKLGKGNNDYLLFKQKLVIANQGGSSGALAAKEAADLLTKLPPDIATSYGKAKAAQEKCEVEEEKLRKLNEIDEAIRTYRKNSSDSAFKKGDRDAFIDIKKLAKNAGLFNQTAFEQEMKKEEEESKNALRGFGKKGSEAEKLNEMFHEAEQYASKSGRASILYGVGQAFSLKSRESQTETLLDMLSKVDFVQLQLEMAEAERNTAKINMIEEAKARGKEGVAATGQFLDSIKMEDVRSYGLSNTVMLRAPEILIQEAKALASEGLVGKEEKRVKLFEEELAQWTNPKDEKRRNRVNFMLYQLEVDLWAISDGVYTESNEFALLQKLKKRVEDDAEKKQKQFGGKVTLEKKKIEEKHLELMSEHINDLIAWKEEEIIDLSMRTYSKLVKIMSESYGIKARDIMFTVDSFVQQQLELKMLEREPRVAQQPPLEAKMAIEFVAAP